MTPAGPVSHLFAGVAVADFATARAWYERRFGRPPDVESTASEATWHVVGARSVAGRPKAVFVDPDGTTVAFFGDPRDDR